MSLKTLALVVLMVLGGPTAVGAERVFYRAELWLETSPPVRRLSLLGILRSWEELTARSRTEPLSPRLVGFVRLHDCLTDRPVTVDELLERITHYGARHAERTYYSMSDFVGEALRGLCATARKRSE